MGTLIGWLAIAAVLYFIYFVVKRISRFLLRRGKANTPLHDELADAAEDIAAASRVAAALSSAAAFFIAPAGLLAIGAALGVVSVPLIVKLAPILIVFAVGAAALSAAAKLYAKSKRRRK
ncbi:hypothetical protein [Hydrogenophaga sp.]|uniref:hypothetical protein n=1 Tax=Hydrogenophaga sp. TaxID=1904254 RepID=UPI00286DC876|nr:hypothetical protein [Hydrogenophaga sp.]